MQAEKRISLPRKILYGIRLVVVFISVFGMGSLTSIHAQAAANNASLQVDAHVLSNGQFVYGPNVGDFNVKTHLEANAPHLLKYADDLYRRSEYFSINPKIYLTLLEIHSHLISVPDTALLEDPFGLNNGDFISQIEYLSNKMSEAYYLHLYTYSPLPVSQYELPPFVTPTGITINVAPDTNAGTYAIIAGLAAMDQQNISLILDNGQTIGFYQTYASLFGNDDPLDENNHVTIPGEVRTLAAPNILLQLPYLQGLSWKFGGVHNTSGGTTFTDASSLDFYPSGSSWGIDTSNMWVVASASGIPTRYSDCGFKISHSGALNVGWETTYYHLEGAKYLSGSINRNDKIGVIANTEAEATCTGGAASGPHVHFSLKYNGAFVAINGKPLSGWYVHSGKYSYDVDHNYMWLERAGVKKYPFSDVVLSEAPPVPTTFTDVLFTHPFWRYIEGFYNSGITVGCSQSPKLYCPNDLVTRGEMAVFLLRAKYGSSYTPNPSQIGIFADVPYAVPAFTPWIKQFYQEGITVGCNQSPLMYCPQNYVTRGEMAVFILRAVHGNTYQPNPSPTGMFADLPYPGIASFTPWIEEFYNDGITVGCNQSPLMYCPQNYVTRGEMAVFIDRAFGIPLP